MCIVNVAKALSLSVMALSVAWDAEAAQTQRQSESPPDATNPAFRGNIEEVLVTARKRAETLQEVPLAVTVLDASTLQNNRIEAVDDLFGRVPGLYFTHGFGGPASDFIYIVMRGVGFNGVTEPATGVFIDGMYQPQLGYDVGFLDLERVEVLRGPQGTLFGRNTQAGAINLVTRKPDENLSGRLEAEVAEFGTHKVHGAIRGPFSKTFFGGLSAEYAESDGFLTNRLTGEPDAAHESYSTRGSLRWLPTDALELNLAADLSHRSSNEIAFGPFLACECYDTHQDNDLDDEKTNSGLQLLIEGKVSDAITLTSITGYRDIDSDVTFDADGEPTVQTSVVLNGVPGSAVAPGPITVQGTSVRIRLKQELISQELRLTGESGPLEWLAGTYYFDESQNQKRAQNIGPGTRVAPATAFLAGTAVREDFDTNRDGWALFGQASWHATDKLELTLGTRYSNETVQFSGERMRNIMVFDNANPLFFEPDAENTFTDLSSMASVSYQFTSALNGYATVAQGWKGGGFNRFPSVANAVLPYDSETSTNYEVGLKSAWPAQRVSANLAVFYIDIEDQQFSNTTRDPQGVTVSTITNAGKSRSQGAELELTASPTDRLDLSLALAYTDGEFVDFTQRTANPAIFLVRDGQPFDFVPKVTGSATVEYRFPVFDDAELALNANYRYVDKYPQGSGSFLAALGDTYWVEAYDRLDLRASLDFNDWRVSVFARNALDSFDYTGLSFQPFAIAVPTAADFTVQPLEPRTFGFVVSREF